MALGNQLENNHMALLVSPAKNSKSNLQPFSKPPKKSKSLKRLLKKARLALLPANLRLLNQEIKRKEKTPIISHLKKKTYTRKDHEA